MTEKIKNVFILGFMVFLLFNFTPAVYALGFDSAYPSIISPVTNVLPQNFSTIMANGETYYYNQGVFYQKDLLEQKYVMVPPPIGGVVYTIPAGYQLLLVGNMYYYVYNSTYYVRTLDGYRVTVPPVDSVIVQLPPAASTPQQ